MKFQQGYNESHTLYRKAQKKKSTKGWNVRPKYLLLSHKTQEPGVQLTGEGVLHRVCLGHWNPYVGCKWQHSLPELNQRWRKKRGIRRTSQKKGRMQKKKKLAIWSKQFLQVSFHEGTSIYDSRYTWLSSFHLCFQQICELREMCPFWDQRFDNRRGLKASLKQERRWVARGWWFGNDIRGVLGRQRRVGVCGLERWMRLRSDRRELAQLVDGGRQSRIRQDVGDGWLK